MPMAGFWLVLAVERRCSALAKSFRRIAVEVELASPGYPPAPQALSSGVLANAPP